MPDQCIDIAWKIVNDSYRSDFCFRYPPHLIALGALCVACAYVRHDCSDWLQSVDVELGELRSFVKKLETFFDDFLKSDSATGSDARTIRKLWAVAPRLSSSRSSRCRSSNGRRAGRSQSSRTDEKKRPSSSLSAHATSAKRRKRERPKAIRRSARKRRSRP